MSQTIYQVDAFTDKVFSGNPAAVCLLDRWLPEETMQKIAAENNLAETAFCVKEDGKYSIRWFTPTLEVDLCGHATLASAFVLFNHEDFQEDLIQFHSGRSGPLSVRRHEHLLTMNFPADRLTPVQVDENISACFDIQPQKAYKGKTDFLLVYESESEVTSIIPHMEKIRELPVRGVIITAPGSHSDFVSRFFAPQSGVDEDPVTGSAHTSLIPYWAKELGKNQLSAIQLSPRKGYLQCEFLDDRVEISGECRLYMKGEIYF